jgi:predicted transcriptional regulator
VSSITKKESNSLQKEDLLNIFVLICLLYILSSKLLWPSTLEITYVQGNQTIVEEIPDIFTYSDTVILVIAGVLFGASIVYLYITSRSAGVLKTGQTIWEKRLRTLEGKEKEVYRLIKDRDGFIFQKELLEETAMPKSTLTVVLDRMEAKKLLKRERRGMSNVVVLL